MNNIQTKNFWNSFNKFMWYMLMIVGGVWLVFFTFVSIYLLEGHFYLLPFPFTWLGISYWLEDHKTLEMIMTFFWILSIPCTVWLIVFGEISRRKLKKDKDCKLK